MMSTRSVGTDTSFWRNRVLRAHSWNWGKRTALACLARSSGFHFLRARRSGFQIDCGVPGSDDMSEVVLKSEELAKLEQLELRQRLASRQKGSGGAKWVAELRTELRPQQLIAGESGSSVARLFEQPQSWHS